MREKERERQCIVKKYFNKPLQIIQRTLGKYTKQFTFGTATYIIIYMNKLPII